MANYQSTQLAGLGLRCDMLITKQCFPMENPGNPGQIVRLGSEGLLGAIFIVNIIKRIAPKLHRIILLHFGLVTFRIHFGKTLNPLIFMVFGPSGRDHDSHISLWRHQGT